MQKDSSIEASTIKEDNLKWHVVYTKAKHEKKVALLLQEKGIEAYCPTKIETKIWSDRKKKVETPLFRSYCFVNINSGQYQEVLNTNGVVRYIFWCGKPAVVQNIEIIEIKRWLSQYKHDQFELQHFEPNQKIEINSGVFKDKEAEIVKQNGNYLILRLNGLGVNIRCRLDQTEIKKVI